MVAAASGVSGLVVEISLAVVLLSAPSWEWPGQVLVVGWALRCSP